MWFCGQWRGNDAELCLGLSVWGRATMYLLCPKPTLTLDQVKGSSDEGNEGLRFLNTLTEQNRSLEGGSPVAFRCETYKFEEKNWQRYLMHASA